MWTDNERTSGITDLPVIFFPPPLFRHPNENIFFFLSFFFFATHAYKMRERISVLDKDTAPENILTLKIDNPESQNENQCQARCVLTT